MGNWLINLPTVFIKGPEIYLCNFVDFYVFGEKGGKAYSSVVEYSLSMYKRPQVLSPAFQKERRRGERGMRQLFICLGCN